MKTIFNWKEGHGEVSIYIGEEEWQEKGYASDALQLLLKYRFCELRLHRIYAIIFEYNEASIKFFEKMGLNLKEDIGKQDSGMVSFMMSWCMGC